MKVIAFANSKGGVSKTTSCLAVGCCLAELGHKVLMIDLDHQANLSADVGRADDDYTVTDLFENPKTDINTLIQPAEDQGQSIPNLFCIPADITLAVAARGAERFRHRLNILEDGLKKLKAKFDYVLLDLRPAIDLPVENGLLISDVIVIPINMDKRALSGIDDLLEVTDELKRGQDYVRLVVRTQVNKSASVMINKINDEIEKRGYPTLASQVGVSELFKKATDNCRPVTHHAPNSKPHAEYMQLSKELLEVING